MVRVKNRFHPRYNAAVTAGYRDVCINLRLTGPRARDLACAHHVCELQLSVLAIARHKSEAGHRRYIAYRNALGA